MSKRIACLGIFAVAMIAANPPGAAKAWDPCYDHPCPPRYYTGCYRCYPRDSYSRYPRYHVYHVYHHYYDEHPRRVRYVRYGSGYDAYDGSYYRYYSSYRYDDDYDW